MTASTTHTRPGKAAATPTTVVATNAMPLSLDSQALLEVGRSLLSSAPETARDACKFFVTLASSGVPVYIALLHLLIPPGTSSSRAATALSLVPGLLFLAAIVAGANGLRPVFQGFDPNAPESIDKARTALLQVRAAAATRAFLFFSLGVLATLAVAAYLLVAAPLPISKPV